jgi:hypothetical protein
VAVSAIVSGQKPADQALTEFVNSMDKVLKRDGKLQS